MLVTDSAPLLIVNSLLPYIAGVGFYHAHPKRGEMVLTPVRRKLLRFVAWVLLLVGFWFAAVQFGIERGIFVQFFCSSLALTLSLFVATRWLRVHWYSGAVAIGAVILLGVSQ